MNGRKRMDLAGMGVSRCLSNMIPIYAFAFSTLSKIATIIIWLAIITPTRAQDVAGANQTAILAHSSQGERDVLAARAPRDDVWRYDVFAAPSYLGTARLRMVQRGFNGAFGIDVNRWLTIGSDCSIYSGHSDLQPQLLISPLRRALASAVVPGTGLHMRFDSKAYTFAGGPQFNIRPLHRVAFLIRPAGGAVHETIALQPDDPVSGALVTQLIPLDRKSDLTVFYGVGGGIELTLCPHIGMRSTVDFVHMNLYRDILAHGENSLRISIAPVFHFGRKLK